MRCDVKEIIIIAPELKIETPRRIDGLARYRALYRTFWLARKDDEDFELEELICDQRASELVEVRSHNSSRIVETAGRSLRLLKLFYPAMEKPDSCLRSLETAMGFPLVNLLKCLCQLAVERGFRVRVMSFGQPLPNSFSVCRRRSVVKPKRAVVGAQAGVGGASVERILGSGGENARAGELQTDSVFHCSAAL